MAGINSTEYRVSLERFDALERNTVPTKPRKNIQECRKARRNMRVFNNLEKHSMRRSKSLLAVQPKFSKSNCSSSPCLYETGRLYQDIKVTKCKPKEGSLNTSHSISETSVLGRRFAMLRPISEQNKNCCCSEHLILHLNFKYFTESSKIQKLRNMYDGKESLKGFAIGNDIEPRKSQSLIFLQVCDSFCAKKQHQVTGFKFSFVKRVKHFICCCVRKSISQSNLQNSTEKSV